MDKLEFKERYLDSVKKGTIDLEFICLIIEEEIKKNNLKEYIRKITYYEETGNCLGTYDSESKTINIDPKLLNVQSYNMENHIANNVQNIFSKLLNTIYHEITHAKQEKMFHKYNTYYCKLHDFKNLDKEELDELVIIHSLGLTLRHSEKDYDNLHNLFPCEREANFLAAYKVINLECEYDLYTKKEELEKLKYLAKILLADYKKNILGRIECPFEKLLNNKMNKEIVDFIFGNKLDNYQRLIYGLPIDRECMNEIIIFKNFPKQLVLKQTRFEDLEKVLTKKNK